MAAAALSGETEHVAAMSKVTTRVLQDTAPIPYALTRATDYEPFNAGGFMTSPGKYNCSSGFGVRLSNGGEYVSTARHCSATNFRTYSSGNLYGTHTGTQPTKGGALLLTGKASYTTFSGAYNSGAVRSVVGDAHGKPINVTAGNVAYTSGGNTGLHEIKVASQPGWSDPIGPLPDAYLAHEINYGAAAGPGDSGGPVFVVNSAGQAVAVGMIQAGDPDERTLPCPAITTVMCSPGVYYTPFLDIINSIPGSSLVTLTNH
jgi:hypothetical protein